MKKKLGVWMLTALVVGNMMGSGIFLLPASLAQYGTVTVFSWIGTALGSILLALVFAKLAILFPQTGGPYIYCKKGFGDFIGFQVAYNYWLYMWVGNAAIAVAFTGYLSTFWTLLATDRLLAFFVTAAAVWSLSIVNIVGVHFAGLVQTVLTILKFSPLILITIIGFFFIEGKNLSFFNVSNMSTFQAFSSGAMLTLWAFLGMESASIPADDVENPQKNIPRATLLGTVLTACVYIASTIAIMGVVPISTLRNSATPFADLAGHIFGTWGRIGMGAAAVIACFGALNGWILLQGQVPLAAAKDDLFPRKFAQVSKTRAPVFGIVTSSICVTVLLVLNFSKGLVEQFTFIISMATFAAIVAYLYTSIAEFVIYAQHGEKCAGTSIAKSLVVSGLAFVYTFWMMISSGRDILFYGTVLMFTSIPVYGWMKWKKRSKALHKSEDQDLGHQLRR